MKKFRTIILSFLMVSLISCGQEPTTSDSLSNNTDTTSFSTISTIPSSDSTIPSSDSSASSSDSTTIDPSPTLHTVRIDHQAIVNLDMEIGVGYIEYNSIELSISGAASENSLIELLPDGLIGLASDLGEVRSVIINYSCEIEETITLFFGDSFLSSEHQIDSIASGTKNEIQAKYFVIKNLAGGGNCLIDFIEIEYFAAKVNDLENNLPIVSIDTNDVVVKSKNRYVDATFDITNVENPNHQLIGATGGIRVRGNSTAGQVKRPYRIKFDKKQSLFGLQKAKSWVLLADYFDRSGMHNFTAMSAAKKLSNLSFTVTPNPVIVYLNGTCVGLYILTEKIQENEGRLNIETTIPTKWSSVEDLNFYFCIDYHSVDDASLVEGRDYFIYPENYSGTPRTFNLEYPKYDDFMEAGLPEEIFYEFFSCVKTYMISVHNAFASNNAQEIRKYANVDSLTDYAILDGIMGARDHENGSFYFIKEAGKLLSFGPPWDFDLWAGGITVPSQGAYYPVDLRANGTVILNPFVNYYVLHYNNATSEGKNLFKTRYREYGDQLASDMIEKYWELYDVISYGVKLNMEIWHEKDIKYVFQTNWYFYRWLQLRQEYLLDFTK